MSKVLKKRAVSTKRHIDSEETKETDVTPTKKRDLKAESKLTGTGSIEVMLA
jgi:hypothetical protein